MNPLDLISTHTLEEVLAATPVLMSFWGALIPAVGGLVGGFLKKKGADKKAKGEWEANRPAWERDQAQKAGRAQLVNSILGGLGIGGAIPPEVMKRLTTMAAFPNAPSSGWQGMVGGALSDVAPHLYRAMNPGGGIEGGVPGSVTENFGGPLDPVNPETIAGGPMGVDDYIRKIGSGG